ncbi:MAG: hypothetical protein ACT4OK_15485 [Gemmobacter sp.]
MRATGLRIAGPEVWRGLGGSARGRALLAAFHERHVPLTPALAEALARLEGAAQPGADAGWGRAYLRAGEALGIGGQVGGAFWTAALPVFATTVAEPILRHAAGWVDTVTLFGAAPLAAPGAPVGRVEAGLLEAAVNNALSDVAVMGRGFWVVTGVALHGAATRAVAVKAGLARRGAGARHLAPEPDAALCRLMFETEPEFPDDRAAQQRRQRTRAKSVRKRSGIRPKEGGVAGIRPSRRIEDFPDAVFSELILPPQLLVNRLLHEGLLVRHRPPLREPKRDLLALCFCDAQGGGDGAALAKAAWADAGLRLRLILAQRGLDRSDLVWAEAGPDAPLAAVMRTEEVVLRAGLDPMLLAGPQRADMLIRSGLLPGFADLLPRSAALDPAEGFAPHLPALAALGVQELQDRARPVRRRRDQVAEVPVPADYARHLVLACLPARGPEGRKALTDWTALRAEMRGHLRREVGDKTLFAALLWPDRAERGAAFTAVGDVPSLSDLTLPVPDDPDPRTCLAQMLGALSAWMIDLTLEALDGR